MSRHSTFLVVWHAKHRSLQIFMAAIFIALSVAAMIAITSL